MLFSAADVAPESGVYKVFSADGTEVGSVRVAAGDFLPPSVRATDYFEREETARDDQNP